jgi:recombination protein RecR
MNVLPPALTRVIESFEKLPGIGPKSATRLAFYLLHCPQDELDRFSQHVASLKKQTALCAVCRNVTLSDPCPVCSNPARDHSTIAVVEQPTDVLSIEKSGSFGGVYHVLHGALDPLNNIGPDEIYLTDLIKRAEDTATPVREIIFALNPNMEGEATSMYIQKKLREVMERHPGIEIKMTRLAHGLPIGADIEYADEVTLRRALEGRREY